MKYLLSILLFISVKGYSQGSPVVFRAGTASGSYLSTTLPSGQIYVGNGSNVATAVTPSGGVTMTNSGNFTITALNGVLLSGLSTGILKNTTGTGAPSIAVAGDFPTLNQNTTGTAASAAIWTTTRSLWGNSVNGSADITSIIASTYGGTGNGFTKFSGPTTSEKTFTLPDASAAILTDNAVVTGAQGGTGVANTGKTITISGNVIIGSTTNTVTLGTNGNTSVTFPTTGTLATISGTETLINKRWVARVNTITSSATPAINTDVTDVFSITALSVDISTMSTSLTGSPNEADVLIIYITGTAQRNITWGSSFVSFVADLPPSTNGTTTLAVSFQYFTTSAGTNKWHCWSTNYVAP